jgi:phage terminase large subunit
LRRDNPWFPETLRLEKDSLKKRDPEAYDNVWEGKCRSAVEGAIYAREIEAVHADKRLRPVPYDPVLPVHTVWDLGWADAMTVIMAQRASSEVRIIDYIETSHKTYAEIVAELETRKYRWGKDFLPHDSKAKNPQTGKSAYETVQALGRKVQEVPDIGVEEGIRAARQFFSRVYFDETRTARLVHCLKRYRRAINQTTNLPGAPLHDEFSHGADAFRYLAVAIEEMAPDAVIKDPYGAFRRAYG